MRGGDALALDAMIEAMAVTVTYAGSGQLFVIVHGLKCAK